MYANMAIILALGSFYLGTCGCGEEDHAERSPGDQALRRVSSPPAPRASFMDLRSAYRTAANDEARWEIVAQQADGWHRSIDPANYAKRQLLAAGSLSLCWLLEYPGILKRVVLVTDDLRKLGTYLPPNAALRIPVGMRTQEDTLVWRDADMDSADVARTWLALVTGVEFESEAALTQWLREGGRRAKWDPSRGRFVLPQTVGKAATREAEPIVSTSPSSAVQGEGHVEGQ